MEVFEKDKIDLDTGKISENGFNDVKIKPQHVQDILKERMLVDGFDVTVDLEKSQGTYLYDSKHNRKLLDFFTFVASNPIGMNHPRLNNQEFINRIGKVALNKPSLSDIYANEQAQFVYTFFDIAVPEYFKYAFFIEGGALAVENALKAAFDWKVNKNFKKGYTTEKGHKVIHFKEAFHGRSGYTLSLTNTDPNKTNYFPKFNWPRITNPKMKFPIDNHLEEVINLENQAINEIKQAIADNKDDIACMILEPIQGEGGDNQFRKEFFVKLREICDENEILLILDEVQTGIALTGKWWAHQHYVQPDLISFGKKTQVCGVLSTDRIDEVEENVFRKPSRINSTWGGNIVDMVRFSEILKIIRDENLVENSAVMGEYLQSKLRDLTSKYDGITSNARGLGLFSAFDCEDAEMRNTVTSKALENGLIILGCGSSSIRFRPPVNVTKTQIDEGINILDDVLSKI